VAREVDWSIIMPSKKDRPEPPWQVILEDIRSHNRTTLEAVQASHVVLTDRIDRFEERTESRFTVIEAAIQSNTKAITGLDRRVGSVESRMGLVEHGLGSLEQKFEQSDQENRLRFASLEAALQRIDQESRSRDASLEVALRDLKVSVQQNSVDMRDLAGKVEALSRLEDRVSALERRGA
jgi:chromosome segregation ATPase